MKSLVTTIAENTFELLYPTCCYGCGARGSWFCANCTAQSILTREIDHCQICNRIVSKPGALCSLDRKALGLTGLVSFGDYRARPLQKAIRSIKFDGIFAGAGSLVAAGKARYQPVLDHRDWTAVIPIPLSHQRLRDRGFNQAELFARAFERTFLIDQTASERFTERHGKILPNPPFIKEGVPGSSPFAKGDRGGFSSNVKSQMSKVRTNLIRTRDTQHQTELGRKERESNIEGAFAWQGERLSGSVLLIDDVVTTGATLAEAARVLHHAGAREVWGLTLAYET